MKMIRLTAVSFTKLNLHQGLVEGREEEVIYLNIDSIMKIRSLSLPDHEVPAHVCTEIVLKYSEQPNLHRRMIVAESPDYVINRLPLATPRNM